MDYQNGKIYRIVCNITGLQYIGSTTQALSKRLSYHKSHHKQWLKGTSNYITSFKIIESGNYDIVLIELYPCSCKSELERQERHHIETIVCVNKYIPCRTLKEYYTDNREKQKQYYINNNEKRKQYIADNKEKIKEKQKQYYITKKIKIKSL